MPDAVTRLARWVGMTLVLLAPLGAALAAPCDIKGSAPPFVEHVLTANVAASNSWCALCGYGYVTIVVTKPSSGARMSNLTVVEDLRDSGLTYASTAPKHVRISFNGGSLNPGPVPTVGGTNNEILTWTNISIPNPGYLDSRPGGGNNGDTFTIVVAVTRAAGFDQERLISADRRIRASMSFDTDSACADSPQNTSLDTLPLCEPISTVVITTGRNYDAGRHEGIATTTICPPGQPAVRLIPHAAAVRHAAPAAIAAAGGSGAGPFDGRCG